MNMLAVNVAMLRKRTGLNVKQLADMMGVGETTVRNIETGYTELPPEHILEKLSSIFGTTPDGLMGRKPLEIAERSQAIYVAESISNETALVEISKIVDTIFVDRDVLEGYRHFGLRVKDNSMANARICSGDTVLVREGVPIKNGDIAVVIYKDSDAVVRRVFRNEDSVILKAESDSRIYPDVRLDIRRDKYIELGKVIKCLFDL